IAVAGGGLAEVEDVDDVLVANIVDGLGLPEEAHEGVGVLGELPLQKLDGDLLADAGVQGQVDRPHAALTEDLGDAVAADLLSDSVCHARKYPNSKGYCSAAFGSTRLRARRRGGSYCCSLRWRWPDRGSR